VSLIAADAGTPRGRTSARGGLLVIEDVTEDPYRLDGFLTRLLRMGALEGLSGVVCGSWEGCGPYERVRAVLVDRLGGLGIPVIEELGFGHGPTALTIPLGVPALLDAPQDGGPCTLTAEVPALV
jgi:muramoyltetrapeptide carboxypeptidase